jgi:hypothetical protein
MCKKTSKTLFFQNKYPISEKNFLYLPPEKVKRLHMYLLYTVFQTLIKSRRKLFTLIFNKLSFYG